MSTATAPTSAVPSIAPKRRFWRTVGRLAVALAVAMIMLVISTSLAFLALNVANIGNPTFWVALLGSLLITALVWAMWLASSSKTPTWIGMLIMGGLLLFTAVLVGVGVGFSWFASWSWTQFGLGLVSLVLIGAATGIQYVYKYVINKL